MSLPTVSLEGRLVADPEMRTSQRGDVMAKFAVACNERRKDESGQWVNGDTTFVDVIAWGWLGEAVVENYRKGARVLVLGDLRQWKSEAEGQKRSGFEVKARSVALVPDREGSGKVVASPF